ncbi:MAG: IS1634 family transposase [Desulfonatronovibrio sp.]
MKKGRPYYYVRETARVNGKSKVVSQVYLGSVERILSMALNKKEGDLANIKTQEYGSLFLANLVEKKIGVVDIIDSIVQKKGKRPSIGEYFLYAAFNRMIEPKSKSGLPGWYKGFAFHQIRPVDIKALDSKSYWKKWDQVSQDEIEKIASALFKKVSEIEPIDTDCLLFDTTNYFTYLDKKTDSELAMTGKNKEGKNWLRQIGLALLVSRQSEMPLFYREYEGNCHDSKLFNRIISDIYTSLHELSLKNRQLIVIMDKGMNSQENFEWIDQQKDLNFVTTYSTYFAEELAQKDLSTFLPIDIPRNKKLIEQNKSEDQILAWRTKGEFWGKDRTVVVTYNPRTAAKQRYSFEKKLKKLQDFLFEARSHVRGQKTHWKSSDQVQKRYNDYCQHIHLPKNLYDLELSVVDDKLQMKFNKNYYRISKYISRLGRNIIITSKHDWSTEDIVMANLDRYQVEDVFRQSKSGEFGNLRPIWHWTDSKIRCHILCCIIALTYLRLIKLWLKKAGLQMSIDTAMGHMRRLHSCLCWHAGKKEPVRMIEDPTPEQEQILSVFDYKIDGGVLQKLKT